MRLLIFGESVLSQTGHARVAREIADVCLSRDWDVHPEIVGDISSKQVHGMCTVYVDDVFFTGDVKYMKWFEKMLTDRFKCKPANWNESKYLGMMMKATSDGSVELTSDGYERCIQEIIMSPERAREMDEPSRRDG